MGCMLTGHSMGQSRGIARHLSRQALSARHCHEGDWNVNAAHLGPVPPPEGHGRALS